MIINVRYFLVRKLERKSIMINYHFLLKCMGIFDVGVYLSSDNPGSLITRMSHSLAIIFTIELSTN